MKKQQKKKKPRLTIDELVVGKPWSYIVMSMPPTVQRNTVTALDAYEKGNVLRMAQAISQIKEGDTRLLRFMLAVCALNNRNDKKCIEVIESLIEEEQTDDSVSEFLPDVMENIYIPDVTYRNIMSLPPSWRIEVYRYVLAKAYDFCGNYEKIVEAMKPAMPLHRKAYGFYEPYLVSLINTGDYGEGQKIAKEIISLMREGKYGKDFFYSAFVASFEEPRDADASTIGEAKSGKSLLFASDTTMLYQGLIECDINLGDMEVFDSDFGIVAEYVKSLPDEVKYADYFVHLICNMVIESSVAASDKEIWRKPFKKLLDYLDEKKYFSEHDPANIYSDLLPSGYRVLEGISFSDDEELDDFVKLMVGDTLSMLHDYGEESIPENAAYQIWFQSRLSLWNLAKYVSEGNAERVARDFEYIGGDYPYSWKLIAGELEGMLEKPDEYMDKIKADLLEASQKRLHSKVVDGETIESALEASYNGAMESVRGSGSVL